MLKKCTLLFLTVILCQLLASNILVARPEVDVRTVNNPTNVKSKTFDYRIIIKWLKNEADYRFVLPYSVYDELTVVKQGESQASFATEAGEWVQKEFIYTFESETAGQFTIPSWRLPYIDPSTQKGGVLQIPETFIVLKNSPPHYQSLLIVIALCGFVGLFLFLIAFKIKKGKSPVSEAAPMNPYEDRLSNQTSLEAEKRLPVVTNIFKDFICDYYHIQDPNLSEFDVMNALKSKDLSKREFDYLQGLFSLCLEAKFAGSQLSKTQVEEIEEKVKSFINSKAPVTGNSMISS